MLVSEREHPVLLPDWHEGLADYLAERAGGGARMKMLVTGGAGFIGSNFARHVLDAHPEDEVVVLDKLTYAGRVETIQDLIDGGRCDFVQGDIADQEPSARRSRAATRSSTSRPSRTSTARSRSPATSSRPTCTAPTCCSRRRARAGIERYVQISTDEVYGSIEEGSFTEQSPLDPSSPYSASKAGGDLLVSAYCHTYGMNATVCRASNNYGPYQYPEKLIPLCVLNALHGDPLPVYGDGMQVRNWLHVDRPLPRHRRGAAHGQGRRDLQHRRAGRAAEHRGRAHDPRADGRATSR